MRSGAPRLGFLAFFLAALIAGCGTPEDKARDHVERGRELLADSKIDAALIEFKNALRQDPKNIDASIELAKIALRENNAHDAIFYYREAYTAKPADESIGVELSLLELSNDLDSARRVIDEVIAAHPDSGLAEAASSQIYQSVGEIHRGLLAARRAVENSPEVPGMHWQHGASCQAMIYRGRVMQQSTPDRIFEEGIEAYENFIAVGGEPWKARLEQARVSAGWPGHEKDAIASARIAVEVAEDAGDDARYHAARHLSRVAKAQGNRKLFAEALEVFIELNPRDLIAWKSLAELHGATGARGGAPAVYKRLLARDPSDADAHIIYTAYIAQSLGVRAGLKYFDRQIAAGVDPPKLLAEKVNLQRSVGLTSEAAISRRRLKAEYPDSVWRIIEDCRHGIREGNLLPASVTLRNLAQSEDITDVFVLLSQVEMSLGNLQAALAAAETAVEVAGRFDPKAERILAIALVENAEFAAAIEVLQRLELRMGLLPSEDMLLVEAHYGVGDSLAGRGILLGMLEKPMLRYSKEDVVLEYSRREMSHPGQRDRIRVELDKARARNPHSRELLAELVELDLAMGRQAVALGRLASLPIGSMTPELAMLRARLRANAGDLESARGDAKWVFRKDPSQPDLLALLVTLYTKLGVVEEENTALEKRIASLTNRKESRPELARGKLAWNHLLHSRLLLAMGQETEAVRVLGAAIFSGEWVRDTKLDFAYLTAKSGNQLDMALEVARSVTNDTRPDAHAIDTVGYVYLKQGDYASAYRQFTMAIKLAKPPRALFYYHLYISLSHLERPDDALRAIRSVLTIDPEYPNAVAIRNRLQANLEAQRTSG
jgi:tetratricopeptide (TPR) repeat protein